MKIAFIVTKFPTLSETFVLNQITGLIDRGHQVDIYAGHKGDNAKIHADVEKYSLLDKAYYTNMPRNKFWRLLKAIGLLIANFYKKPLGLLNSLNIFKYGKQASSLELFYMAILMLGQKKSYDIIHAHFGQNGLKASILKYLSFIQGKVVTTFHGNDITTYLKKEGERAYDLLFQLGDYFLPISERWKGRLIELGCKDKIIVHRMGIDCKKFAFSLRKSPPNDQIKLVTIARLVEKKGVEYGIRAFAKLKKTRQSLNYTIVGDGPLKESLQQLIDQLDINDAVKLVGWKQQQEVIKIIEESDILLAPSVTSQNGDQEGIPVTLMETMAMGLPIISTQHSGIPELIESGKSGFLVPERDVDALAQKLNYLIENPEVWSEMGLEGRNFVEQNYDINKLNDKLVQIYRNLLDVDTRDMRPVAVSQQ